MVKIVHIAHLSAVFASYAYQHGIDLKLGQISAPALEIRQVNQPLLIAGELPRLSYNDVRLLDHWRSNDWAGNT